MSGIGPKLERKARICRHVALVATAVLILGVGGGAIALTIGHAAEAGEIVEQS